MHVSNSMIIVNVSNYDHVEQFISSSAMNKAVADDKSSDKSVNRLPYGLLPQEGKTIPLSKTFVYTGITAFSTIL